MRFLFPLSALLIALLAGRAPAKGRSAQDYAVREENGRTIDEIALSDKRRAIGTLLGLLKNRRNTADEANLLIHIVELDYEEAAIQFRIANGDAIKRHHAPDLAAYRATMMQAAEFGGQFIQKFPNHPDVARIYYLRAKSLTETNQKEAAIHDLRVFVDRFPRQKEMAAATIALGDLLIERKDYPTAIQYLTRLTRDPTNPSYTLALDRLAWIYYYLNDIPSAMGYLEAEIRFYRGRAATMSNAAIYQKEKVLGAAALFYSTGMEKNQPGFDALTGLRRFQALAGGPDLDKLLVRFAYLLRTKGLDQQLEALKSAVLGNRIEGVRPLELMIIVFGNQLNKRRYAGMNETARQMSAYVANLPLDDPRYAKVMRLLSDSAVELQNNFTQNKNNSEGRMIAQSLTTFYGILAKAAVSDESVAAKIQFNMAEIQFNYQQYAEAVLHFRWVVEHVGGGSSPDLRKLADDAKLKAIDARYEALRAQKLFPDDLKTRPLMDTASQPVPREVAEWLDWMDDYANSKGSSADIEAFLFESNRLLYSRGHVHLAIRRLNDFINASPKSKYAIPAASLIIDTYIATQNWDETYRVAIAMLARRDWAATDFGKRLVGVAGDAYFKRVESFYRKQRYQDALAEADNFLKLYPTNQFRNDCLSLAANAALALNQRPLALQYFDLLKKNHALNAEQLGNAHLTSAAVAEDRLDFEAAAQEYVAYLATPDTKASESDILQKRKRALLLAWLSGDSHVLGRVIANPRICSGNLAQQCQQFQAMDRLSSGQKQKWRDDASGDGDILYVAAGLNASRAIPLKRRMRLLELLPEDWGRQDPAVTYPLMAYLSQVVPPAIRKIREEIRRSSPLKLNKSSIAERTALVERMESIASKLEKLPSSRIQAVALNEVASLYMDFSADLKSIPAPRGLTPDDLAAYRKSVDEIRSPFEAKALQIREKALKLASDSGVDHEIFAEVASAAFNENPGLKATFARNRPDGVAAVGIDAKALAGVLSGVSKDQQAPLRQALVQAVRERKLQKTVYLVQAAEEKQLLSEGELHAAKAIIFDLTGGRAEALAELALAQEGLDGDRKTRVLMPLVASFYETFAFEKTQKFMQALVRQGVDAAKGAGITPAGATLLSAASQWTGVDISSDFSDYLLAYAKQPQQRTPANEGAQR